MHKTNIRFLLLSLPAIVAGALALSSCREDNPVEKGQEFAYRAFAFGSEGSQQLVLDKLSGGVKDIACSASWLTASDGGVSPGGHPILLLDNTDGNQDEATVTVTDTHGDKAVITVVHSPIGLGDTYSGANDEDFITGWWNVKEVALQGFEKKQKTPWTDEGGVNIPEEVFYQYRPEDGWEMAFCYLNEDSLEGVRIFALYNRWTGQMRVYPYIKNPTGWGSDIVFRTVFGESRANDMYPLYNVFEYGIPTCHVLGESLQRGAQLVEGQSQTFMTWLSPYMVKQGLSNGWYVLEFDMSGYVPEGKDWLHDGTRSKFKFYAETDNTQKVTLRGMLQGGINGEYQAPKVIQEGGTSALYGFSHTLDVLSGMSNNSISSCSQYATLMNNGGAEGIGAYLNPLKMWGGFACSIGSAVLGYFADKTDPITLKNVPGKINLTLDADLNLEGYITSFTSNNFHALAVAPEAIDAANGADGHVGKGVWGLDQDPVVYIDKDVLLSSKKSCRYVNRGEGTYSQTQFEDYDMRMVWFFDPTSVKVNLNTQLFQGVQNVSVTTTCGVYPNRNYGNTDRYREMLMLPARPSVDISQGKGTDKLVTLNESSSPRLVCLPKEDLVDTDSYAYETAANCSIKQQPGSNIRFYGRLINEMCKQIMVDPQVYVPYEKKDDTFFFTDPVAPDFVVTVHVVFETAEGTFHYSKCYIPRIELIDHNTAKNKISDIRAYSEKCRTQQSTGTLSNNSGVRVYNPDGNRLVEKTLRLYDKIK